MDLTLPADQLVTEREAEDLPLPALCQSTLRRQARHLWHTFRYTLNDSAEHLAARSTLTAITQEVVRYVMAHNEFGAAVFDFTETAPDDTQSAFLTFLQRGNYDETTSESVRSPATVSNSSHVDNIIADAPFGQAVNSATTTDHKDAIIACLQQQLADLRLRTTQYEYGVCPLRRDNRRQPQTIEMQMGTSVFKQLQEEREYVDKGTQPDIMPIPTLLSAATTVPEIATEPEPALFDETELLTHYRVERMTHIQEPLRSKLASEVERLWDQIVTQPPDDAKAMALRVRLRELSGAAHEYDHWKPTRCSMSDETRMSQSYC